MVCPRCVMAVELVLNDLAINFASVDLGKVVLDKTLDEEELHVLEKKLNKLGFELLKDKNAKLIENIKLIIQSYLKTNTVSSPMNLSDYLVENLHQEYGSLSRLFSSVEGMTIEKYLTLKKIERIKELLFYDEMPLKEIANQLNYSSVAYLSNQFKKETGMTPTQFKQLKTR